MILISDSFILAPLHPEVYPITPNRATETEGLVNPDVPPDTEEETVLVLPAIHT